MSVPRLPSPSDDPRPGRLRENGAASVAELREFLSKMRGKPPQEVLGLIAQSGLARAMFLSTLIMVALLLVTTALPFAWNRVMGKPDTKSAVQNQSGDQAGKTTAQSPSGQQTDVSSAAAAAKTSDPKEAALGKLGVGETKTAPRNTNPLEGRADDILKDFEKR